MCPPHKDVVFHTDPWEILSIDGMIFIAVVVFAVFALVFGTCQVWYFIYKKNVLLQKGVSVSFIILSLYHNNEVCIY